MLEVMNALGQLIYASPVSGTEFNVVLPSGTANGMYLLRLAGSHDIPVQRFLLQQ
jgi:hypothetical protein